MENDLTEEELEQAISFANYNAEHHSEEELLELLKVRNGKPHPKWDEDDLAAFKIIRRGFEMALEIKRAQLS